MRGVQSESETKQHLKTYFLRTRFANWYQIEEWTRSISNSTATNWRSNENSPWGRVQKLHCQRCWKNSKRYLYCRTSRKTKGLKLILFGVGDRPFILGDKNGQCCHQHLKTRYFVTGTSFAFPWVRTVSILDDWFNSMRNIIGFISLVYKSLD